METGRSLICGIVVIPSVSLKDRPLEVYLVMLNAASHIVGRIKSFRPPSRVAQFRPGPRAVKVRTLDGSKDVRRAIGVSPRVG